MNVMDMGLTGGAAGSRAGAEAMGYSGRLQTLRARFGHAGTAALLLTHGPDVRYLCGFTGSNAVLLLLPRRTVLLTDGRYTTQAREETAGTGVRVTIAKQLLAL